MLEVRIDELQHGVRYLRTHLERFPQLVFDERTEPEASCHGKHNGQHRHGRQYAAVGECRCVAHQVVLRDALHHYHQPLGGTQPPPLHRGELLLVDAPDIVQVRHGYCLWVCLLLFIYIMCAALRRAVCCLAEKDSRPVSRVLYAPQCGGVCHLSSADVTISLYRSTLRLGRAALS